MLPKHTNHEAGSGRSTKLSIAADLELIANYDTQIAALETHLTKSAKVDDPSF